MQEFPDFTGLRLDALLDGAFDVESADTPDLPSGDKSPFRQMTFTLHDSQFQTVESALAKAKKSETVGEAVNENSNGNALALICTQWLEARNG